jgi:hypothetical protein
MATPTRDARPQAAADRGRESHERRLNADDRRGAAVGRNGDRRGRGRRPQGPTVSGGPCADQYAPDPRRTAPAVFQRIIRSNVRVQFST